MTVELDCSLGEGGGSVVRVSAALAASMEKSLTLVNIRAKRRKPGLRAQHIEAINAIKQFSGAEATGLHVGSGTVELTPGLEKRDYATVKIATAGSIGLVAQAVQNYACGQTRDLQLEINGGATHGKWAPSIEYIHYVTHTLLDKIGKTVEVNINRYGFFPRGGAHVTMRYKKHDKLSPLQLEELGTIEHVDVYSIVARHLKDRQVAERQYKAFVKASNIPVTPKKHIHYVDSLCPGTGLTAVTHYSSGAVQGTFYPGERGITSEQVGEKCAREWKKFAKGSGAVDEYATDQLIVPLSLIEGTSVFTTNTLTKHTKTNIELAKRFTGAQISTEKRDGYYRIKITNT